MEQRGVFIAFEGIDGSGKTTQLTRLRRRLDALGLPCLVTKEPSDGPVGLLLRQILTGAVKTDERVTAPLFVADRLDHILNPDTGLLTALSAGKTVLTDRYYFSSYAYQSFKVPMEDVIAANVPCASLLRPDLTLFFDLPPETAMERIRAGRDGVELFEDLSRLRAVREAYFAAFDRFRDSETVRVLDADGPPEVIEAEVWGTLSPLLTT